MINEDLLARLRKIKADLLCDGIWVEPAINIALDNSRAEWQRKIAITTLGYDAETGEKL